MCLLLVVLSFVSHTSFIPPISQVSFPFSNKHTSNYSQTNTPQTTRKQTHHTLTTTRQTTTLPTLHLSLTLPTHLHANRQTHSSTRSCSYSDSSSSSGSTARWERTASPPSSRHASSAPPPSPPCSTPRESECQKGGDRTTRGGKRSSALRLRSRLQHHRISSKLSACVTSTTRIAASICFKYSTHESVLSTPTLDDGMQSLLTRKVAVDDADAHLVSHFVLLAIFHSPNQATTPSLPIRSQHHRVLRLLKVRAEQRRLPNPNTA